MGKTRRFFSVFTPFTLLAWHLHFNGQLSASTEHTLLNFSDLSLAKPGAALVLNRFAGTRR